MKHIGKEIHRLVEEKGLVKREVAAKIGMSSTQFNNLRNRRSIGADILDRVSKAIGVSPAYFFEDDNADSYHIGEINNTTGIGDATVNVGKTMDSEAALRELLAEKERLIRVLMKQVGIDCVAKS